MMEFVLVEFLFEHEHGDDVKYIMGLGDDFIHLTSCSGTLWDNSRYFSITGQINSETATMIKLSNESIAARMRISYIDDKLKDKYRS